MVSLISSSRRAWHVAEALQKYLPQPFPRAASVLVASLGPELETTEEFGLALFRYLPHVFFVQKYGLEDFDAAMHAQYELTKRFSAEGTRPRLPWAPRLRAFQ